MDEYVESDGSRDKIVEEIMAACSLDKETAELSLNFIKDNQEILSSDEFFQYCQPEEYEVDGVSEFVSERGSFYISLKKSTILLVILYISAQMPGVTIAEAIADFWGVSEVKKGFLKLDARQGYLCIMLELARHRRNGVGKTMLRPFQGECCNNHINCNYNENGLCNCDDSNVEKICEELMRQGIIKKKGKKYFYVL